MLYVELDFILYVWILSAMCEVHQPYIDLDSKLFWVITSLKQNQNKLDIMSKIDVAKADKILSLGGRPN
jgi:hypothetical protein